MNKKFEKFSLKLCFIFPFYFTIKLKEKIKIIMITYLQLNIKLLFFLFFFQIFKIWTRICSAFELMDNFKSIWLSAL